MKTSNKKPKLRTAEMLWHEAVEPIVKHCQANRGAKAAILRKMNELHPPKPGQTWTRQDVDTYLLPDRKKRTQPGLGNGLALIASAQVVMAKLRGVKQVEWPPAAYTEAKLQWLADKLPKLD